MRIVLMGASTLGIAAARFMLEKGHEVVMIEEDPDKIDELRDDLDCGFVCGDGSRPSVLREVGPEQSDFLFCLSNSDQDNIIAALVGRKLEFSRVIVHIKDPDFASVCSELDIDDVIVPDQEVGQSLSDIVEGNDTAALTAMIRRGLRFLSISVGEEECGRLGDLDLPDEARVVALTRGETSQLVDDDTALEPGDELLALVDEDALETLRKRFKI